MPKPDRERECPEPPLRRYARHRVALTPTESLTAMEQERMTRAGRISTGGTNIDAPYDRVFVHDLVLDAEIGVYTHEKGVTQRARFSVDIEVAPSDQAIEDQIGRVLDYDMIIETIKDILAQDHINLVETLADEIATRCLAHPRAASVKVKIEKLDKRPGAVGGGTCAGACGA